MKRRPALESLQGELLDAALEPNAWQTTLGRVINCFDAYACDLYLMRGERSFFAIGEGPQFAFAEYVERFLDREPRSRTLKNLPAGQAITDLQFVDRHELRFSDYYADFLPRVELGACIGGIAVNTADHRAYIGIHYPYGRWEVEEEKMVLARRLQPMLARAVNLQFRLAGRRLAEDLKDDVIEHFPQGLIALDEYGRIHLANAIARDAIADRAAFRVRHGRLECTDSATHARFQVCVQSALTRRDGLGGALLVAHAHARYSLFVTPARVESYEQGTVFAFVFITRLGRVGDMEAGTQLRALFGLSITEARLAARLVDGHALKRNAEMLGITYESARFTLKQIFGKVGVHSQAELVAVLSQALHPVPVKDPCQ